MVEVDCDIDGLLLTRGVVLILCELVFDVVSLYEPLILVDPLPDVVFVSDDVALDEIVVDKETLLEKL